MDKTLFNFQKFRDFGDVIGDSFKFTVQNLKVLALGFLLYVIPLFLLGAGIMLVIVNYFGGFADLGVPGITMGSFMFLIGIFLASFMTYALVFATIDAYQDNEGVVELNDLWPYIKVYLGKIVIVTLFFMSILIGVVAVISLIGGLLGPWFLGIVALILMPLFMYLAIRFVFVMYIYAREDRGLIESYGRSSFMIQDNWWWTFLIVVVLSIIASIMSYVVGVPVMIYTMSSAILSADPSDLMAAPSTGVLIANGVSTIAQLFAQMYFMVGIVVHYYSLQEKKEGTSIMDKIDSIGESTRSEFENEGEY